MTPILLTVISGLIAGLCLLPGASERPLHLLANFARPESDGEDAQAGWLFRRASSWMLILGLCCVVVILLAPGMALWVLSGAVLTGALAWLADCGRQERLRLKNRDAMMRACRTLAGQIEIGELPAQALQVMAQDEPMFVPVAGAAAVGADPVAALRALGAKPGCAGATQLAIAWELCQRTGMSLGASLARVTTELIAEAELETARESELASALSTGRLLAGLPLVGLGMGFVVGADPLAFLTSGFAGQLCVFGASVLSSAGLVWTQKLAQPADTRDLGTADSPAEPDNDKTRQEELG
jgi:tight adherence protein B